MPQVRPTRVVVRRAGVASALKVAHRRAGSTKVGHAAVTEEAEVLELGEKEEDEMTKK